MWTPLLCLRVKYACLCAVAPRRKNEAVFPNQLHVLGQAHTPAIVRRQLHLAVAPPAEDSLHSFPLLVGVPHLHEEPSVLRRRLQRTGVCLEHIMVLGE